MKTIEHGNASELSNEMESNKLTIEANGKAFKELISGIYSDKAYAIARETFANGVDSHVQANIPERAIEVHVPTIIEPFYSIRDFGVSMSHNTVMTLYRTLFRSSKDDPNSAESNKYVGKFGLGSKSPFAYTDSFQLTTILDGTARIYDVFFNAGMPQIALLSEEETSDERGVLVSFGVNPKDINDFIRAIKRAAEGLDVKPIFTGTNLELHKRVVKAEGEGWKLLDATQSRSAEARQGTVLYPLNFQAVIDVPPELSPLFSAPFHFDFPIGSLDIVTSREALSYDEATSKNIIERLKLVQADIAKRVLDSINSAETYWDFSQRYFVALKTFPESQFGKIMKTMPTFQGRRPQANIEVKTANIVKRDTDAKTLVQSVTIQARFGNMSYSKWMGSELTDKVLSFREDKDVKSNKLSLNVHQKLIVVMEDMREKNRYPGERIRKLMQTIDFAERRESQLLWIRHTGTSQYALRRLFTAFGRPDYKFFNLMDVEHTVAPRSYTRGIRMPFKKLVANAWVTPELGTEVPEKAYWVPMRNGDVDTSFGGQFERHTIRDYYSDLVALGMDDLPIIGIPASSRKIAKQAGLIELYPHVKSIIADMFDAPALLRVQTTYHMRYSDMVEKIDTLTELATSPKAKQLVADAFMGSVFEEIFNLTKSMEQQSGDEHQQTVLALLNLFDKERVKAAVEFNANFIRGAEAAGAIVDRSFLQREDRRGDQLKNVADIEAKAITEKVNALSIQANKAFPLFAHLSEHTLRHNAELRFEILNYVFNKRLMQEDAVVDIAVAA